MWASTFIFYYSIIPLFLVIGVGILFDIVGTAVTAANETPLHAMAADKVFGAKQAIWLVRRADRVANFCNDVVGDICGTASGGLTAVLVYELVTRSQGLNMDIVNVISLGLVAALTVGGKAWGKSTAINRADQIVFKVGQALATWDRFGEGMRLIGRGKYTFSEEKCFTEAGFLMDRILDKLNLPEDLKKLSNKELTALAGSCGRLSSIPWPTTGAFGFKPGCSGINPGLTCGLK